MMDVNNIIKLEKPIRRVCEFDIKAAETDADSKSFKIRGYASTFNNMDRYNDIMMPGAFKKSLETTKGKWPILFNHREQVGVNLSAKEDKTGLYVESELFNTDKAIPKAAEATAIIKNSIKRGLKMGLSIGGLLKKSKLLRMRGFWAGRSTNLK